MNPSAPHDPRVFARSRDASAEPQRERGARDKAKQTRWAGFPNVDRRPCASAPHGSAGPADFETDRGGGRVERCVPVARSVGYAVTDGGPPAARETFHRLGWKPSDCGHITQSRTHDLATINGDRQCRAGSADDEHRALIVTPGYETVRSALAGASDTKTTCRHDEASPWERLRTLGSRRKGSTTLVLVMRDLDS